jgi:hypothetical protein
MKVMAFTGKHPAVSTLRKVISLKGKLLYNIAIRLLNIYSF